MHKPADLFPSLHRRTSVQTFMQDDHTNISADSPSSEGAGTIPNTSEQFGTVPNRAESFRTVPNGSESFRTLRNRAERKSAHTLTVKEAARLFEAAGVSRTERSIVKWCQPNKHDVARLDAFFDSNERKWFITEESVELAIGEEKARAARRNEPVRNDSEPDGGVPNGSEARSQKPGVDTGETATRVKELENQVLDLKILNGGKDFLIDQIRKEREGLMNQAVSYSRRIGQLEAELRQLSGPRKSTEEVFPNERDGPEKSHDIGNRSDTR